MASYQNLIDNLQRSEIITNSVEGVIASARATIPKAQALIQDDKQKLTNERR